MTLQELLSCGLSFIFIEKFRESSFAYWHLCSRNASFATEEHQTYDFQHNIKIECPLTVTAGGCSMNHHGWSVGLLFGLNIEKKRPVQRSPTVTNTKCHAFASRPTWIRFERNGQAGRVESLDWTVRMRCGRLPHHCDGPECAAGVQRHRASSESGRQTLTLVFLLLLSGKTRSLGFFHFDKHTTLCKLAINDGTASQFNASARKTSNRVRGRARATAIVFALVCRMWRATFSTNRVAQGWQPVMFHSTVQIELIHSPKCSSSQVRSFTRPPRPASIVFITKAPVVVLHCLASLSVSFWHRARPARNRRAVWQHWHAGENQERNMTSACRSSQASHLCQIWHRQRERISCRARTRGTRELYRVEDGAGQLLNFTRPTLLLIIGKPIGSEAQRVLRAFCVFLSCVST